MRFPVTGWLPLSLVLVASSTAWAADLVNKDCPVVPGNPALASHSIIHMGKPVQFCCADCLNKFLDRPDAYLANLPQFELETAKLAQERKLARIPKGTDWFAWPTYLPLFEAAGTLAERHRNLTLYALIVSVVFLAARHWRRAKGDSASSGATGYARFFSASNLIVLVLLGMVVELIRVYALRTEAQQVGRKLGPGDQLGLDSKIVPLLDDLNEQALLEARAGVPYRLSAVYYRGNDERNPRLFNNGFYCTCTIQVRLCTEGGAPLDHGAELVGAPTIELTIVRAPHSSPSFFTDAAMAEVFLAHQPLQAGSAVPLQQKEVRLEVVESGERWRAVFPLGAIENHARGVVYVCNNGKVTPNGTTGTVHYGIGYRLRRTGGKLDADSHLWVAPLYFSNRGLAGWFSHEPLPTIPDDFKPPMAAAAKQD
ncbi:MAG: hypothetical protein AB7K24_20300 [Gemmataceae bacterium]